MQLAGMTINSINDFNEGLNIVIEDSPYTGQTEEKSDFLGGKEAFYYFCYFLSSGLQGLGLFGE